MTNIPDIPENARTEIEAAVFRKMMMHFQSHPEVQNIDLMNLAYFCRNCFSKWYAGAATEQGIDIDYDQAREIIYGMPFGDYKAQYQGEATEQQLAQFKEAQKKATE